MFANAKQRNVNIKRNLNRTILLKLSVFFHFTKAKGACLDYTSAILPFLLNSLRNELFKKNSVL